LYTQSIIRSDQTLGHQEDARGNVVDNPIDALEQIVARHGATRQNLPVMRRNLVQSQRLKMNIKTDDQIKRL
jgi:hypothetical protein